MNNEALIGKIISWPNIGEIDDDDHIGCGRGEVVAILDSPFILVKRIPRKRDDEPPHMIVLPFNLRNMHIFNNLREEQKWFEWVFDTPEPVVKLVSDSGK